MVVTAHDGLRRHLEGLALAAVAAAALIAPFLLIDLTFLGANLLKVFEGGWVPLALGGVVMLLMCTWRRGSRLLFEKTAQAAKCRSTDLVAMLEKQPPQRVPGTAVFLTSDPDMRADRADAQPQALQGAAREERHPDHRDRADAARRRRPSACGSSRSARPSPA